MNWGIHLFHVFKYFPALILHVVCEVEHFFEVSFGSIYVATGFLALIISLMYSSGTGVYVYTHEHWSKSEWN